MTNDTKLSDLTVGEFKALIRECLQQDMDAKKEVERLRAAFLSTSLEIDSLRMKYSGSGLGGSTKHINNMPSPYMQQAMKIQE